MGCICCRQPLYCARMAEQQDDLNAFSCEDSAGAVLMLGVAPVVGCYVFFEEKTGLMIFFGALAVGLAALVYLLGRLTGWRLIGTVVNLVGSILVPLYIAAAIWLWMSPQAPHTRYKAKRPPQVPSEQQGEVAPRSAGEP